VQNVFVWLEATGFARTVGESLSLTAWLSALHLIGFTLVMSGALIWNLRAAGLILTDASMHSVARPASRLLGAGLVISVATGFALFAPRASQAALVGAFQLKMALLVVAAAWQLWPSRSSSRRPGPSGASSRVGAVVGAMLWLSLAVAGCWFILFE
jgi:hypothetical protein